MKSTDITVRRARMADFEEIMPMFNGISRDVLSIQGARKTLRAQLILDEKFRELSRGWVKRWIRSRKGLVLLAEVDGEVAGYSLSFSKKNLPLRRLKVLALIDDIYVKPRYRGIGVSSALKDRTLGELRRMGFEYASIEVHARNRKAHEIYKKWGFEDYATDMRKKL